MTVEYYATTPHYYYLEHAGVQGKSGRYKWGSGERPYQRLERAKRKGFFSRRKEEKARKIILEKKKKELEERRKEEEEKARLKADKERVMREGSATEIKRYLPELTNAELEAACNRIKWMNTLNDYVDKEAKKAAGKSTFDQVDSFMTKLGKVNKWGETSIATYKNAKQIVDMLSKASKKTEEQSKKDQKKEKKES